MPHMVGIVTGASRGIGRAVALELARRGVTVALASRDREACLAVAEEVAAAGGAASAHGCDVADAREVDRLVAEVASLHGRVDVLVNNAGVIEPIGLIDECDPDAWRRNLEVNACGPFYAVRAVAPHLRAAGSGVVVNVSSGAAHSPREGWSAYCASKAALAMLTRSVHLELSGAGVLCYGFQPGVVDTEMQVLIRASGINEVSRLRREDLADPHVPARLIALLCLGRPEELAGSDLSIRDPEAVARIEDAARRAGVPA